MLLAYKENAFPSDVGPQSKEDQTEGIPEGSSLVDPLATLVDRRVMVSMGWKAAIQSTLMFAVSSCRHK